jgi:hypothetical protein
MRTQRAVASAPRLGVSTSASQAAGDAPSDHHARDAGAERARPDDGAHVVRIVVLVVDGSYLDARFGLALTVLRCALTVRTDGPISDAISRVLLPVHDTLETPPALAPRSVRDVA